MCETVHSHMHTGVDGSDYCVDCFGNTCSRRSNSLSQTLTLAFYPALTIALALGLALTLAFPLAPSP